MDGLGDLALHLEADQERLEEFGPGGALPLGDREARGQRRHRGMGEQPEDPVGRVRELRVVEVGRMTRRSVGARRQRSRRP